MASLQSLCDGNSLSILKGSDQVSVSETPDLSVIKVPQVSLGNPTLDAIRASGVSITRVFPAASVPVILEEEPSEKTDPTWGGPSEW